MHFKQPEILYFLFLLVIPILVHLFQLRRFKTEYFTNVRLLTALSIETRQSSKIKKWLLLLTRLLILTCLILAFAQPYFEAKGHTNKSNELYVVLDNSFSMQAKGQKGALLKRAVQDLLENTPENKTFSLITNSETFWNTDIKSVQTALQNLKYSASPFQLESALAKIKSRKSSFNKDIVVITDAVGLQPKELKSIDSTDNTYFIVPKAEQKNNVSVDSVFIKETLDDFYEIGVKISAYGKTENKIPVALYHQNKLIAKTLITLKSKEKIIPFTIPKKDFHGYVTISDNGLTYDNTLYFSISKPQKTNVLSIGEVSKSAFLSRIYTTDEFNYHNFEIGTLDYNSLEKQQTIVLNELAVIPESLKTTLKSFVEKGGNLIVIPAAESNVADINPFLLQFGKMQFGSLQNTTKLVTQIAFKHPLFQSVFEKQINNFQYPNTKNSFTITGANAPVLSYEDQSAFLTSWSNQIASVYVFSAPINKSNSNFQQSPLIVPTFYNMAQNSQNTGVLALTIGNNQPFLIDSQLSKDEIVTVRNSIETTKEEFIPEQQIMNQKVKLAFNDYPEQAGNFGIFKKEALIKNISFNYNRSEGNLTLTDDSVLSDYNVIDNLETVFNSLQTDRTDEEIWKWFVILTLLFLVTEVFIQKFAK
jgi:hypothetical protein